MILAATRSLTLPPGLRNSAFPKIWPTHKKQTHQHIISKFRRLTNTVESVLIHTLESGFNIFSVVPQYLAKDSFNIDLPHKPSIFGVFHRWNMRSKISKVMPTLCIDSIMEESKMTAPMWSHRCWRYMNLEVCEELQIAQGTAWKQTNSRRESGPIPNEGDFSLPHNRLLRRDCGSWSAACYRSHPEFRLAHFPIHPQFFPPEEASAVLETSTIWTPFASYATTEHPQPQAVPRLQPRWQLPPRPTSLALCDLINLSSTKALQNHTFENKQALHLRWCTRTEILRRLDSELWALQAWNFLFLLSIEWVSEWLFVGRF